ncbi:CDP-diacylglycerol diphosphatase [Chromobacterium phragmitis]|uniref:CDP-diacylglycerol pyrophosphatase n=1 Tax=Chromobacterium phragmitis TaxID=2202141 RepID=A0A344UJV8_9NEIS|nr:CDP-diacylglycerol diphosphatase [Chromobacterium phragmitis]AXE30161.1 CDP-diacylglycerol diphosphatase [Chromobacterium phragmitis]AXE35556.1 CDP-diacylglycerol diphosphatase [Chromobacterium phragmitis]
MRKRIWLGGGLAGLLIAGASYYALADSDALWRIVGGQCVPAQQGQGRPGPCAEVKLDQGVAVLKDRNGPLQYLLIPTAKVSGIESPALLSDGAPDYWREAWRARGYLDARRGQPLPRMALSLTINSQYGRSQNQLHIHISCTDATVRQQVDDLADGLQRSWRQLPVELKGHAYWARRVDADGAGDPVGDAFQLLANGVPGASAEMGRYGMAMLPARFDDGEGFVLLATRADLFEINRGSAEELQDHGCRILQP